MFWGGLGPEFLCLLTVRYRRYSTNPRELKCALHEWLPYSNHIQTYPPSPGFCWIKLEAVRELDRENGET